MKNKILILFITLITASSMAFAIEDGKVISDSESKKMINSSLNEINQYTDSFFTPSIQRTQVAPDLLLSKQEKKDSGRMYPVKKLRLKIQSMRNPQKSVVEKVGQPKDQALLDCDTMEYFADKSELHADGNVVLFFPESNSTIKSDKLIYNQSTNLIKAFGRVILISDGKEIVGDYMQVDLNEENAFLDNPVSELFQISAKAKKGYMYGDKIIQEQGSFYVKKKTLINLKAEMFGPDLDTMFVPEDQKSHIFNNQHGEKFKIKTNDLIINAKKDHDTVTLKRAEIYFNDKKVVTLPSFTVHTDKGQNYIEADYPELGSVSNLGMYAGPGFVFDTPGGTTLKVLPILNYQSNGDNSSENSFGFGGIAKFKSASNKTDFGYGTANKVFIMRGVQRLDDNLYLQYAANSFMDDWFLGFRMPKFLSELVYKDSFYNTDFLGKGRGMVFTHRVSGGYMQDGAGSGPMLDGEGAVGTGRAKYMAEVAQTLYQYNDIYSSPFNARLELIAQGSTAVYGTGDTQMIARIGPRIHTQYKNWMQDVGYFLSGYSDNSPMIFDRYMYGRSNVYLRESYRLCKYLTVSWFGSLNLSQDAWNGNLLQENGFYFAIGPDDIKLNIGYDSVRQQSFVTMSMHLDAKGTTVEYKKMTIKNPEVLGKGKNQKESGSGSSSFISGEETDNSIERAEVVDIQTGEL